MERRESRHAPGRPAALRLAVLGMVLLVTACQTTMPPPPPGVTLPELRGTWTGTWGGTPLMLVVVEQDEGPAGGGIYLGPWLVLGEQRPAVSGVIRFTRHGSAVSTNMRGWLGYSAGLTLVVQAHPADGRLELALKIGDGRLTGTGTSSLRGDPRGGVELTRTDLRTAASPAWLTPSPAARSGAGAGSARRAAPPRFREARGRSPGRRRRPPRWRPRRLAGIGTSLVLPEHPEGLAPAPDLRSRRGSRRIEPGALRVVPDRAIEKVHRRGCPVR